jgi:hypothetical protein
MQISLGPKQPTSARRRNGAKGVIKPPPKEKELIPPPREQERRIEGKLTLLPSYPPPLLCFLASQERESSANHLVDAPGFIDDDRGRYVGPTVIGQPTHRSKRKG